MKKFGNYEEARKNANYSASEKLPAGGYVAKILNLKYEEGKNGNSDFITLQIDICEGDYKDFFKKQYDANTSEDKKWKGRTTIYVPKDDGTESDQWTKNSFARWIKALEDSNDGYTWDWDERKWKGKMLGLVYRNVGNVIEGREVEYTEVAYPCDVSSIRNNTFKKAKDKKKNGYTGTESSSASSSAEPNFETMADDEYIPF